MRLKTFHIIIIILFVIPAVGIVYLQMGKGDYYYDLSKRNYIRLIPLIASRGKVFDRNGEILIDNIPSFNLAILPQEFSNQTKDERNKTILSLSKILKVDKAKLKHNFKKSYIAPFSPVIISKNIPREKAIILEEAKLSLPGTFIQIKPKRFYPYGKVCAHILGYTGLIDRSKITRLKDYGYKIKDIIGYTGIEEEYDRYLRGEDGGLQVKVDHRGRQKMLLGMRSAKKGKNLTLTIDIRIQQAAFESLAGHIGAVVVMNSQTGEILAMVSSPSFNSNIFSQAGSNSKKRWLFNDSSAPLLNRAISGLYSPGSVFKVVGAIAALEKNKINTKTRFLCTGKLKIGNRKFKCWSEHGSQDLREAIIHSCNVFFYNLGLLTGPGFLSKYAIMFGLGRVSGIDLPYESKGNVPNPLRRKMSRGRKWQNGDTANFSIGQGELLVTPIQIVKVMASIVNGGKLLRPYFLKKIEGESIQQRNNFTKLKVKNKNLKLIKSYLREAVSDPTGTSHVLNLTGLPIGGKTGTAQAGRKKSHAWFAGFCPFEKPKVVFCVLLEHGGSSYNASLVAKRLFKKLSNENLLDF